jgi:hypothetical protein
MRFPAMQLPSTRRSFAISVLVAATVAPVTAAQATSEAAFTKKANSACTAAGAKVEALPKITDANFTVVLGKELTILSSLVGKLEAIKPPSSKATQYHSFLSANRKQIPLGKKTLASIKAKDAAKAKSLAGQLDAAGQRSNKLAAGLKLKACAKNYTAGTTHTTSS